jgi:protoporphyrinogen oxidase
VRFVVLGAGLSGLSVGISLARGGHEVVVLEREAEVGGLARSVRTQGFTFDLGPHFLFGSSVLPLLSRITPGLELAPIRRDMERMLFKGRLFKFPFQPKDLLLNMHRGKVPGVCLELLSRRLVKPKGGGSVEDWVIGSVGRRLYDYISLSGYIEKLYGLPASQISREWGVQKLKFLSRLQDAGLLSLVSRAWGEGKRLQANPVSYPPAGIDRLAHALAESLGKAGGKIVLGAEVKRIEGGGAKVAFVQGGREESLAADFVVSTIPVTALLGALSPEAPGKVRAAGDRLRFRSVALLFLMLDGPEAIRHLCIYFTEEGATFRRITEFERLSSRLAPPGKCSLCVEITFAEGDRVSRMNDAGLFEMAAAELTALGLFRREALLGYQVMRLPFAYPVYDLSYAGALEEVLGYLGGLGSVISLGRQGLFHYNTMGNSISSGYEVGERLAAAAPAQRGELVRATYAGRLAKYARVA